MIKTISVSKHAGQPLLQSIGVSLKEAANSSALFAGRLPAGDGRVSCFVTISGWNFNGSTFSKSEMLAVQHAFAAAIGDAGHLQTGITVTYATKSVISVSE